MAHAATTTRPTRTFTAKSVAKGAASFFTSTALRFVVFVVAFVAYVAIAMSIAVRTAYKEFDGASMISVGVLGLGLFGGLALIIAYMLWPDMSPRLTTKKLVGVAGVILVAIFATIIMSTGGLNFDSGWPGLVLALGLIFVLGLAGSLAFSTKRP